MSLLGLLIFAGACTVAVLLGLWAGSLWRLIAQRMERRIELQLRDNGPASSDIVIKAGVITLALLNTGQEPCRLNVCNQEIELASPSVRPGRRREWSIHLAPGMYQLSLVTLDQEQQLRPGLLRVVPALGPGDRV